MGIKVTLPLSPPSSQNSERSSKKRKHNETLTQYSEFSESRKYGKLETIKAWEQLNYHGKIAAIDVETSGLNIKNDRVVQIAIVIMDSAYKEYISFSSYVKPDDDFVMPEEASAIHHITTQQLCHAPTFKTLWTDQIRHLLQDAIIVGYNILQFDLPIIQAELERCGLSWKYSNHCIDLMQFYHAYHGMGLSQAYRWYTGEHINFELQHDAFGDCISVLEMLPLTLSEHGYSEDVNQAVKELENKPIGKRKRVAVKKWNSTKK
ncbi:MAG TPA: 3'-5' exonuclease [Legionellaceae bacterium]|nr:3'-5' exonuclease [Legionellaceae bacterium]